MKNIILLIALSCTQTVLAADSTILQEIMGKATYEEAGLSELSTEQLKALEDWILNNAVEKRVAEKRVVEKVEEGTSAPVSAPTASREEPKSRWGFLRFGKKNDPNDSSNQEQPRYVEISDVEGETVEDEEPVTQKYVRIELLDEDSRMIEPDLIRSRIDGTFKGWRNNKTRFTLENGEVWEQRQSSTFMTNLESPEVIIKKKRFGYTMEVPAIGRSVHVKRIK